MNNKILSQILKRDNSLFYKDINENNNEIAERLNNKRIMVIGAAGSIGSAFVKQLMNFFPGTVHLVNISENNMCNYIIQRGKNKGKRCNKKIINNGCYCSKHNKNLDLIIDKLNHSINDKNNNENENWVNTFLDKQLTQQNLKI